jgi:hypothetical protein
MRRSISLLLLWGAVWLPVSRANADEQAAAVDSAPRVLDQFKFDLRHGFPAVTAKAEADGTVRLVIPKEDYVRATAHGQVLTEGYYLGIAGANFGAPRLEGASLVRMQIIDVEEQGALRAIVGRAAAAKLKPRDVVLLLRPLDVTTKRLKAVPELVPLDEGLPPESEAPADPKAFQEAHLAQSLNNLKQIGLAMHNFNNAYGSFPPAVIRGPDGKPWHSWRVLLLPFLEQQALYQLYRLDEPWDGPNNKQLIDDMPAVYADPIHGENKEHYTHYAAITGPGTAFSAEGPQFDGTKPVFGKDTRIPRISDGLSNTLLVGPISPTEKIPWTKPQDVVIGAEVPAPGKPGSFDFAYKLKPGDCGVFLAADGSVHVLTKPAEMAKFRGLLTIAGDEIENISSAVELPRLTPAHGSAQTPMIYLLREGDRVTARLVVPRAGRPAKVILPR